MAKSQPGNPVYDATVQAVCDLFSQFLTQKSLNESDAKTLRKLKKLAAQLDDAMPDVDEYLEVRRKQGL